MRVSKRVTRLVFIRHGHAQAAIDDIVAGHRGCRGLTDRGREQATALRDRLFETRELHADVLLTSKLPRAIETAEILAPALGDLVPQRDCDLCELHPGECDGLRWEEYRRRYGFDMRIEPERPMSPGGEESGGLPSTGGTAPAAPGARTFGPGLCARIPRGSRERRDPRVSRPRVEPGKVLPSRAVEHVDHGMAASGGRGRALATRPLQRLRPLESGPVRGRRKPRRHTCVWDKPRISPLPLEQIDAATSERFGPGPLANIFATLAHHPDLLRRWVVFGNHVLLKSTLEPPGARARDLAGRLAVSSGL